MNYEEAEKILGGKPKKTLHRSAPVRMEGPEYQGGPIVIRLYSTPIVTIFMDNSLSLRTGGYWTETTKRWMNKYLPQDWQVFQEDFNLYLRHIIYAGQSDINPIYRFEDGVTICKDGWPVLDNNGYKISSEKK